LKDAQVVDFTSKYIFLTDLRFEIYIFNNHYESRYKINDLHILQTNFLIHPASIHYILSWPSSFLSAHTADYKFYGTINVSDSKISASRLERFTQPMSQKHTYPLYSSDIWIFDVCFNFWSLGMWIFNFVSIYMDPAKIWSFAAASFINVASLALFFFFDKFL
jgi:hypothetical protein